MVSSVDSLRKRERERENKNYSIDLVNCELFEVCCFDSTVLVCLVYAVMYMYCVLFFYAG